MPSTHPLGGIRHRQLSGFSGKRVRSGNDTFSIRWIVIGAESPLAAEAYLISKGLPPAYYDFRILGASTAKLAQLMDYSWEEQVEDGAFIFTANYSVEWLDTDEYSVQISTGGGSVRVTSSFGTLRYAPAGQVAPDFKSAIDVQDGKPQGIDRVIPSTMITLTYRMTRPANPLAFSLLSDSLVGTYNVAPFLGRAAGELLYLGGDGNFGNKIDPEMQFSWAASKNAILAIGDIAGIAKAGHDYLWLMYEDVKEGTGADTFVVTKPRAAYVERIYTPGDHSLLGLLLS